MEVNVKYTVKEDKAKLIHDLENKTGQYAYDKYGFKRDEALTETIKLDNGNEVDIKLVIAEDDDYNWTEAVMFDKDGKELAVTEPSDDFFGEWYLEDNENTYIIEVNG